MTPALIEELALRQWTDPEGRLGPDGARLGLALTELARRDRRAYVALTPKGTEVRAWRALWDELALDDHQDLLLLYDGRRWEARGWGLDDAEIGALLDQHEGALLDGVADGLVAALEGLEAAAAPAGSALGPATLGVGAVAGVAALAALGWLVARRVRLGREEAQVSHARAALEDTVAQLILDADALGDPGSALQHHAVRLQAEVRRIPATEDTRIRVARIHQLEDEVVALQSQVLASRAHRERPVPERDADPPATHRSRAARSTHPTEG